MSAGASLRRLIVGGDDGLTIVLSLIEVLLAAR